MGRKNRQSECQAAGNGVKETVNVNNAEKKPLNGKCAAKSKMFGVTGLVDLSSFYGSNDIGGGTLTADGRRRSSQIVCRVCRYWACLTNALAFLLLTTFIVLLALSAVYMFGRRDRIIYDVSDVSVDGADADTATLSPGVENTVGYIEIPTREAQLVAEAPPDNRWNGDEWRTVQGDAYSLMSPTAPLEIVEIDLVSPPGDTETFTNRNADDNVAITSDEDAGSAARVALLDKSGVARNERFVKVLTAMRYLTLIMAAELVVIAVVHLAWCCSQRYGDHRHTVEKMPLDSDVDRENVPSPIPVTKTLSTVQPFH